MFQVASLVVLMLILVLAALIVLLVVRRSPTLSGVTRVVHIVALLMAIILSGVGLWVMIQTLGGANVPVSVPVQPYWPEHPNITDVEPKDFATVDAQITEVQIFSDALSWPTKILLAAGVLFQTSATVAVLLGVATLCRRVASAEPFTKSLRRLGYRVAFVFGIASFLGQVLNGIGASRAGEETLRVDGFSTDGISSASAPWPEPTFALNIEFSEIFMALVILVVVELVAVGIRLTNENRQLQQDHEGLV